MVLAMMQGKREEVTHVAAVLDGSLIMTTLTPSSSKSASATGNVVEGFSKRFNFLLDRAKWPPQHRVSIGAKRFYVVPNTFKFWVQGDRIPGTHALLVEVATELLKEVPGHYNAKAVVAWLLAGDAVPNPFGGEKADELHMVDVYLQIAELAKAVGVDFNALPRHVRNLIVNRGQSALPNNGRDGPIEFDKTTESVLIGMIEMARTMA